MSAFDGLYVKTADSPVLWLVENGERRAMASMDEVYENGLRPVATVSADELESIPVVGKKKKRSTKEHE